MISIAAANDLELIQFNICTIYFYAMSREEVYMDLSEGFEDDFHRHFSGSQGQVCRIWKGLYGLKQLACRWNTPFSEFLIEHDLFQS